MIVAGVNIAGSLDDSSLANSEVVVNKYRLSNLESE